MDTLRKKAEELMKTKKIPFDKMSNEEMVKLLEELQINKIELQLQNEELRACRLEPEIANNKFFNFFDFSPIGFLLLDDKGIILDLNLKAAELFQRRKDSTINRPIITILDTLGISVFHEKFEFVQKGRKIDNFELLLNNLHPEVYIELNISPYKTDTYLVAVTDVTAKVNTLEQLLRNEKKYRFLTEKIIDVLWVMDCDSEKFTYVSPSVENLRGFTAEEVMNGTILDAFTKLSLEKFENNLKRRLSCFTHASDMDIVFTDELEQPKKNGDTVWTELICHFRINPENDKTEIIGVSRDITNRKQTERELKKLKTAVEQCPVTIAITDTNGTLEYVNPAFTKITGYTPEEAIGNNPRVLKSEKTPPEIFKHLWETITNGNVWQGEFINKRKDGRLFHEEAVISPVFDEYGNIINYIAIKNDISVRKQQEDTISMNNERLRHLLELAQMKETDIFTILDKALSIAQILTKSKFGFIHHYDYKNKLLILNSWSNEVMKDCKTIEKKTIYELDKTGWWGETIRQKKPIIINNYSIDSPFKKGVPEGHIPLKRFLSIPVFDENEIIAVIAVANKEEDYDDLDIMQLNLLAESVWSISRQKEDEKKIRRYAEELKEANSTKDKFFSIIAHDLKNPFNIIMGFSEMLVNNYDKYDDAKRKNFLKNIYQTTQNTYKLLENLLEWSRVQRGVMPFNPKELFFDQMMQECFSLFEEQAKAKEIEISSFLDSPISAHADPSMIKTIFRNLLSNAIKFTPRGGTIKLFSVSSNDEIEFTIADSGIGMSLATQENLFRIDTNTSQPGTEDEQGTGLGLLLCKEFIEKHEGKIWVDSEEGKGSAFKFTLP